MISVGGDGTVLSSSHFLGENIPLAGVNSDPTTAEEKCSMKLTEERRSIGALCMCTSLDVEKELPKVTRCAWDVQSLEGAGEGRSGLVGYDAEFFVCIGSTRIGFVV